jgi:hypothetical protein
MKKTYEAPAMITIGSVVEETRDDVSGMIEPSGFQKAAGSVGFNL